MMYLYDSYDGKHVLVKRDDDKRYNSRFLAENEEAASTLVANLNRPLLKDQLAVVRFRIETQGITLGELDVKTDRESQSTLNGAFGSLTNGLITETEWKGSNGWQRVTQETLQPIAQAVATHVAKCFTVERQISEQLDGITDHQAMAEFDVIAAFINQFYPEGEESV